MEFTTSVEAISTDHRQAQTISLVLGTPQPLTSLPQQQGHAVAASDSSVRPGSRTRLSELQSHHQHQHSGHYQPSGRDVFPNSHCTVSPASPLTAAAVAPRQQQQHAPPESPSDDTWTILELLDDDLVDEPGSGSSQPRSPRRAALRQAATATFRRCQAQARRRLLGGDNKKAAGAVGGAVCHDNRAEQPRTPPAAQAPANLQDLEGSETAAKARQPPEHARFFRARECGSVLSPEPGLPQFTSVILQTSQPSSPPAHAAAPQLPPPDPLPSTSPPQATTAVSAPTPAVANEEPPPSYSTVVCNPLRLSVDAIAAAPPQPGDGSRSQVTVMATPRQTLAVGTTYERQLWRLPAAGGGEIVDNENTTR